LAHVVIDQVEIVVVEAALRSLYEWAGEGFHSPGPSRPGSGIIEVDSAL
jgi:hypothetical protein